MGRLGLLPVCDGQLVLVLSNSPLILVAWLRVSGAAELELSLTFGMEECSREPGVRGDNSQQTFPDQANSKRSQTHQTIGDIFSTLQSFFSVGKLLKPLSTSNLIPIEKCKEQKNVYISEKSVDV